MLKVTGFDNLQRQLEEAQRAFKALDGQLATVRFDPDNPESIEAATRAMESAIDERVAPYRDNPFLAPLIPKMKTKYREAILERAGATKQLNEAGPRPAQGLTSLAILANCIKNHLISIGRGCSNDRLLVRLA